MPRTVHIALGSALLAGCLVVPTAKPAACTTSADCDTSAGEVCDDGACYGGVPTGEFAAIVVPPSDRPDLVSTDIAQETLPSDGDLSTVAIASGIRLSGRVEAYCAPPMPCSDTTIAATVTVSRPSRFSGGPGFSAVASAPAGVVRGTDSFALTVPATGPYDAPFTLTIAPVGTGAAPPSDGSTSAAQLAPPMQLTLTATADTELGTLTLGSEIAPVITGTITDATSAPLDHYRVVALGHLGSADAPLSEVSTVDYTQNGTYSITLAGCGGSGCADIAGDVTLEAAPYDDDVTAPTLYVGGVAAAAGTQGITQPAAIGAPLALPIQVQGLGGDGAIENVSGARVIVTSTATTPATDQVSAQAVLEADAQTGSDGIAHVTLLDGAAFGSSYAIEVIPPAGAQLGLYDKPLALDGTPIRLPSRVQLYGTVTDGEGAPVANISVIASPALRYQWNLDPGSQALLGAIPTASAVTDPSGAFSLWVDAELGGVLATYDLAFTVPGGVAAADWTDMGVAIPGTSNTSVSIGTLSLPATAFVHGTLVDAAGLPVDGGELRIFQVESDPLLCQAVADPPSPCVIPAQLLGNETAAPDGTVVVALPRVPATP